MTFAAPVNIGNNVFIGERTIVLPDVRIGDNSIIGAGSVVSSDIPENSVAIGNPCRVVNSISDLLAKRKDAEHEMVRTFVREHFKRGKRIQRKDIRKYVRDNTKYDSLADFSQSKEEV